MEYQIAEEVKNIRAGREQYYWGENNLKLEKIKQLLKEEVK